MPAGEIARERAHVHHLYERLDRTRNAVRDELAAIRKHDPGSGHQARSERDAFARMYEDRLTQLRDVEDRLVFGRLELAPVDEDGAKESQHRVGAIHYIGRLGLRDENFKPVLLDWRVPQASAFYQATAAEPLGARARRHLHTRGRDVIAIDDEVFDHSLLDDSGDREQGTLQGEAALLAAVRAERTGRMHDIVSTIQAEQDRIIRAPLRGALVVQGGPGTGKTAVALHRAAYLLYTHRDRLGSAGVLVVGPSRAFLEYIEAVLPSLGETGVVMTSLGSLYPGVEAVLEDPPETALVKGEAEMARLLKRAVKSRQIAPSADAVAKVGRWEGVIPATLVRHAMQRAWDTHRPHNVARVTFNRVAIRAIADLIDGPASGDRELDSDRAMLLEEIRSSHDIKVILNTAWLPLTPEKLLQDLYARPKWLAEITQRWSTEKRDLLRRDRNQPFTISDVALLDEAAELLGDPPVMDRGAAERERQLRSDLENAEQAIRNMRVEGMVDARSLAANFGETGPRLTTVEAAAGDRRWAYGHIVVDEAQELSPMQWRALLRRGPLKSFTIVGDIAQRSSAGGAGDWDSVLTGVFGQNWHLEELTVNYRTPARISRVAEAMAKSAGIAVTATTAVRQGDWPVEEIRAKSGDLVSETIGAIRRVRTETPGSIALIVPDGLVAEEFSSVIAEALPGEVARGSLGLRVPVAILTPSEAKGLEFDTVFVVEPATILATGIHGAGSLYVAMTRATQRLLLVTEDVLPMSISEAIEAVESTVNVAS